MVAIAPFRGLRYNLNAVEDLTRVVAPPYDVISPEQQDQLYDASPYNIIRLILNKQQPDDHEGADRYARARDTFADWRRRSVLTREEQPTVYLSEHTYTWEGTTYRRLGFIAVLEFEGSVPGKVCLHENTFDGPKADRAKLTEAVRAHLSPVFCVVPDPEGRLHGQLASLTSQPPWATMEIPASTAGGAGTHREQVRCWAVTDPAAIGALRQQLAPATVLIADGHHRFQVALSKRHLFPGVMTYFACFGDPSVAVRPIHRVMQIADGQDDALRAALTSRCRLEPAGDATQLLAWLDRAREPGQLGAYAEGRYYRVTITPEALAQWLARPSVSPTLADLDVTILHHLLLPEWLATPGANGHTVRYTPDAARAVAFARQSAGQWAWFLRPITVEHVFELAKQGLALPQKSTYFYPKVLSGLVINPFD